MLVAHGKCEAGSVQCTCKVHRLGSFIISRYLKTKRNMGEGWWHDGKDTLPSSSSSSGILDLFQAHDRMKVVS